MTNLPGHEVDVHPLVARIVTRLIAPACRCGTPEALTLGIVKLFFAKRNEQLDRHETEHVFQALRMRPNWWPSWLGGNAVGTIRFWLAYAAEHRRYGYRFNKFEIAARAASGEAI